MYDINDKYLYEILDDFKDAQSEEEKDNIINEFMKLIWASKNKRVVNKKYITFKVLNGLLDTDVGKIFNRYSSIEYASYKSMSKQQDFVSLIRQKINNLYTNHCDGRVCIRKEYMDLIKKPKQMYYRWKNGEEFNATTLPSQIEEIIQQSEVVKEKYSKQKMNISWNEYKTLIVGYFRRMFENYIPLEDFEDKTKLIINSESWNEDNFTIAYLCKGLDGYMRNYQKKYYGLPRNKKYNYCNCGGMFVQNDKNNKFKCDTCGTYQPIGTKTIICIDCGKEVEVDGIVKNKKRCDDCQKKYNNSSRMKNYYRQKYSEGFLHKFENRYYLLKDNPKDSVENGYKITQIINPDFDEWYNKDGSEIRYPYLVNFELNQRNILYDAKLIDDDLDFM